jgi:MSHA biogenesis protein MshL
LFICLSLSACTSGPNFEPQASSDVREFIENSIQDTGDAPVRIPPEVTEALAHSKPGESDSPTPETQRFDVSVSRVPAKSFFVSLVSEAGVNVVAHPEIEGQISLNLRNVSVREVLDVVRDVYGYEYKIQSGIYTIYPRKLRNEIFHINYPDLQRVGITDTSILIGTIQSSNGQNNNNNGGNQNQQNGQQGNLVDLGSPGSGNGQQGAALSQGARVQTLTKTNFWPLLQQSIAGIIGGESDGRFVMVNPHAGIAVVKALPTELASVREFLEKSELSVQRQVILETKILEVQLNDQFQSGINWSAIGGALSLQQNVSGEGSINDILNDGQGFSEVLFASALQVTDITKLINLLDRQGDVSVLSSPRISTVNNQKAVIRVGSDEFFVTGIANNAASNLNSGAVLNAPQVELDSFFSGISLDVTPQISENGEVILHVHPVVSEVADQLKEFEISGENFSLPLALRDIRESDSIVKASSGQVVVLGGLMQESTQDFDTRRSWLGKVPVLDVFFRNRSKSLKKTELVILMRPLIVDKDVWQQEVSRGQSSIENFGRSK